MEGRECRKPPESLATILVREFEDPLCCLDNYHVNAPLHDHFDTYHTLEVVNYSLVLCLVKEGQAAARELARTRLPCRNEQERFLFYTQLTLPGFSEFGKHKRQEHAARAWAMCQATLSKHKNINTYTLALSHTCKHAHRPHAEQRWEYQHVPYGLDVELG